MATYDLDHAQEVFRLKVLEALDEAAAEVFGITKTGDSGATDADLPHIFPAIDEQVARLSVRYNHPFYEGWVGSERYFADQAALEKLGIAPFKDDALNGRG